MAKVFYRIVIAGQAGWGAGVLVFDDSGVVVGADAGGVIYQGNFRLQGGLLKAEILVTIPAGLTLVTGTAPNSQPFTFVVNLSLPLDDLTTERDVDTPVGRVRVQLRKLHTSA